MSSKKNWLSPLCPIKAWPVQIKTIGLWIHFWSRCWSALFFGHSKTRFNLLKAVWPDCDCFHLNQCPIDLMNKKLRCVQNKDKMFLNLYTHILTIICKSNQACISVKRGNQTAIPLTESLPRLALAKLT